MFAAQTGLNVYFLVEKCPQVEIFQFPQHADWPPGWETIEQAMNGHSKDCSVFTSQTPLECGPAPLPLHSLALHISHLTQSNILASQTSALLGGRASSVSDEVTISYTYLPSPVRPQPCP